MLYLSGKKVPGKPLLQTPATSFALADIRAPWAVDNGCYTGAYPGDEPFLTWLDGMTAYRGTCLFVACPDVLTDAPATLARWQEMAPRIRERGWPAALVLQDGMTVSDVIDAAPDALFIGGSTEYKLGPDVRAIVAALPDIHTHMGRVNSFKRMRYASLIGCHSVDGTVLAFDPQRPVFNWADRITDQTVLV